MADNILADIFSAHGQLALKVPNFHPRSGQLEMALAISEAIQNKQQLVAEAGTGTGKTFAYLVPALLSGGKVIISTGTKNLQDQLFKRDIPNVREALQLPVHIAMLKGRANYVCHHHLAQVSNTGQLASRQDVRYLQTIRIFAEHSQSGDKSDLATVPETAPIWSQVTSTRDNCLGSDCAFFKECFVFEARKRALVADVVVVNHHLFFADVALRDEGITELLPVANSIIFDEAHQLPEVAGLFFGESVSTYKLLELIKDSHYAQSVHAADCPELKEQLNTLDKVSRDLRLIFAEDNGRLSLEKALATVGFAEALQVVGSTLNTVISILETQAGRAPELEKCWTRALDIAQLLIRWQTGGGENVRWLELSRYSIELHTTPISVATQFTEMLKNNSCAWIFTSATLAVKNDFQHYVKEMGLLDARTLRWESPFNYATQALLYAPPQMPLPNASDYNSRVVEVAIAVLKASRGRTFILSTSLRAMQDIHQQLKVALPAHQLNFPLLLQGEYTRNELLDQFRRLGNAVLIGSQSFWEGVDVRGDALSAVIIDRLPFASPDDPVLSARIAKMTATGLNAFFEYQLPHATITLKQGAGRLIRDEQDRGVLVICDPRLTDSSYGNKIWQSLPPFKRTRDIAEVEAFFGGGINAPKI